MRRQRIQRKKKRAKRLTQLTVRGFDEGLESLIRDLAKTKGISLNEAVLRLLRRSAGLPEEKNPPPKDGSWVDKYVGTMSDEEADQIRESLRYFDRLYDPESR